MRIHLRIFVRNKKFVHFWSLHEAVVEGDKLVLVQALLDAVLTLGGVCFIEVPMQDFLAQLHI